MHADIQLAGICFSAEDWRGYDDDTRATLLACVEPPADELDEQFDDEPTLIRAPARAAS